MKLSEWLDKRGSTRSWLARQVDISSGHAAGIANGDSVSPSLAAQISKVTKGQVSIQELLYPDGLPEGASMTPKTEAEAVAA